VVVIGSLGTPACAACDAAPLPVAPSPGGRGATSGSRQAGSGTPRGARDARRPGEAAPPPRRSPRRAHSACGSGSPTAGWRGRIGVLEHALDVLAVPFQGDPPRRRGCAVEEDAPGVWREQSDHQPAERRPSESGLPHEPERLPHADRQRDARDRLHRADRPAKQAFRIGSSSTTSSRRSCPRSGAPVSDRRARDPE
jgi:hypothetical protein